MSRTQEKLQAAREQGEYKQEERDRAERRGVREASRKASLKRIEQKYAGTIRVCREKQRVGED